MSARKYVLLIAAFLGVIVGALLFVDRLVSSGEPETASTTVPSAATSTTTPHDSAPTSHKTQDALTEAVYKFEEVYNLSVSDVNNQKLRALTTAEGFPGIVREPSLVGLAANGRQVVAVTVDRSAPNTVQPEPFDGDPHTFSVSSRVTIVKTFADGQKETLPLPMRVTAWTNASGQWKLMAIQY